MQNDGRKGIAILGSTGVIGRLTLEVLAAHPDRFRVVSLAASSNVARLAEEALACKPEVLAMYDPAAAGELSDQLGGRRVLSGMDGLVEAALHPAVDMVVMAVSGAVGLLPTVMAIRSGKDIALANKETLVLGGAVVMPEAARHGVNLLPVDSEHSALFQAVHGERRQDVERLILTASGGPFSGMSIGEMMAVTPEEALRHPTWNMGPKITVDSATMMNKGLELIEAMWLFGMPQERIDILIHPQSIVHSLAGMTDGSLIAQMGLPDMRIPISYALGYPERLISDSKRLDLADMGELTFARPDDVRFPALRLARSTAAAGGSMPGVLNAANEVAVDLFLKGEIRFTDIAALVEDVLSCHNRVADPGLEELFDADLWAREKTRQAVARFVL